jgi:CRP/FNR family transcriptional regulator, dissimilatory nitrate respiration regulator
MESMHPNGGDKAEGLVVLLRKAALFEGLDEGHLRELVSKAGRRAFDKEQTLFLEGDAARGLLVVLKGRVKVFKTSPKGREQILMIMKPGDPVGEVAVLSGESYPASAEALEPGEALYIPRQAFLDLVGREPEVAMRLLAALSSRLRSFTSLIEDLSLRDVAERLAAHLLVLAGEAEAGQTVDLDVSKIQLSAAVGTVPETLSRAFKQLSLTGAVETKGRSVHIINRDILERLAAGR